MKLIILACFAISTIASPINPNGWVEIDWSSVIPIAEMPGFWDGREIKPAFYPGDKTGRIVGGVEVARGAHPYQAGLLVNLGGFSTLCGGSVLTDSWILTAAHCIATSTSTQVILGAHELLIYEATQQRIDVPAANYRSHPSFNPSNLNNDISLLQLPTAARLDANVAIILLPPLGQTDLFAGALGQVSGWGFTSDTSQNISPVLRSVDNTIITNAVCTDTYGSAVILDSTICMQTTGGRGTCNGDNGGPLTVAYLGTIRLQVGVKSFGAAAGCDAGYPVGFSRISSFRAWIDSTTGGGLPLPPIP